MKQGKSDPRHNCNSNEGRFDELSQLTNENSHSRDHWSTPEIQPLKAVTTDAYPTYEQTVSAQTIPSAPSRLTQSEAAELTQTFQRALASEEKYIIPRETQAPIKHWVKAVLNYVFSNNNGEALRVVGFGEDGHGTAEHFELQAEATKYMIEHQGARAVVFEVTPFLAMAMNNALRHGEDPQQIEAIVTKSEALVWDNQEIVGLLQWVHQWNADHPDQTVNVVGMSPRLSGYYFETAEKFLTALKIPENSTTPEFEALLEELLVLEKKVLDAHRTKNLTSQSGLRDNLKKELSNLQEQVSAQIQTMAKGTPSHEGGVEVSQILKLAKDALSFLLSMLEMENGDNYPSRQCRDTLMAQRVIDIEQRLGPQARIVVLAHNMHIAKKEGESACYPDGIPMSSGPNQHALDEFGSHMAKKYARRYYAFLSTTTQGSVRCEDGAFERPKAPSESLEAVVEKTGGGSMFLDVRALQSKPEGQPLNKSMSMRFKGWGPAVTNDFAPALIPAKTMDGAFHFEQTKVSSTLIPSQPSPCVPEHQQ